jgi:endonuclease G
MSKFNFKDQISKRWLRFGSELHDVNNLLHQNADIGHLESRERQTEFFLRQKLLNQIIHVNAFWAKIDEHKRKLAYKKDGASADDVFAAVQESIQGATNDIMSTEFFEGGTNAAMSVGKVDAGIECGTGFLIGKNLMLTNHHVIEDASVALGSTFIMDFEDNFIGVAKMSQEFDLDPGVFFMTDKHLDFTIVAVNPISYSGKSINDYGFHPLIDRQGKIKLGDSVNIIHHPEGSFKRVSFRNNQLILIKNKESNDEQGSASESFDNFCLYLTDTLQGSSGAPVFNDRWEVVAVHHAGAPIRFKEDGFEVLEEKEVELADLKANEGIRTSRIVRAIEAYPFDETQSHMKERRDSLLRRWKQAGDAQTESSPLIKTTGNHMHVIKLNGLDITINIKGK